MNRRLVIIASAVAAVLVVGVIAAVALGGSSADDSRLSAEYQQGAGQNYASADGSVVTVAAPDREDPVDYGGTTDEGDEVAAADFAGRVTVLNFWYASCPPCRAEAPDLVALDEGYDDADVAFLGVNVMDDAATARSFATAHDIAYPSILDQGSNEVQLAFAGEVPPNAVPTTLVLDRDGRVAARFSGLITDPELVRQVVDDVLAETA